MERKLQKLFIKSVQGTLLGLIVSALTTQVNAQNVQVVETPRNLSVPSREEVKLCNDTEQEPTYAKDMWNAASYSGVFPGAYKWLSGKWKNEANEQYAKDMWNAASYSGVFPGAYKWLSGKWKNEANEQYAKDMWNAASYSGVFPGAYKWLSGKWKNEANEQRAKDMWNAASYSGLLSGAYKWLSGKWKNGSEPLDNVQRGNYGKDHPLQETDRGQRGMYNEREEEKRSLSNAICRKLYDVFGAKNNFDIPESLSICIDLIRVPNKLGDGLRHEPQKCIDKLTKELGIPVYCLEVVHGGLFAKSAFFKKLSISNQKPVFASVFTDRPVLKKMHAIFGKKLPIDVNKAGDIINPNRFLFRMHVFDHSKIALFVVDHSKNFAGLVVCHDRRNKRN